MSNLKAKKIIELLNVEGFLVTKKEPQYSGGSYTDKYCIVGSEIVDAVTEYLKLPTNTLGCGFICKNGVLQNFFIHNGIGFDIPPNIQSFIEKLKEINLISSNSFKINLFLFGNARN